MTALTVERWAAWAPGLDDAAAWIGWSRDPGPLGVDGAPDAAFLPPLLRRRCSRLARAMISVARACGADRGSADTASVFASRHGELTTTVACLRDLAAGRSITASAFSHSVYNAQAGLFSIATDNRQPSTSLAGGRATFGGALVEALGLLQRGAARVFLVVGDEPVPDVFRPFIDEPQAAYAVGLVLGRGRSSASLDVAPGGRDTAPPRRWPEAAEFLRWLLSEETAPATVRVGGTSLRVSRGGGAG